MAKREVIPQAAVIPYQINGDGKLRIALITSASGRRWTIPKGIVDPGEDARTAAARECAEEAGLRGELGDEVITTFCYEKWGATCAVEVFLLHVTRIESTWPEDDVRSRKWFSQAAASKEMREAELRELLLNVHTMIQGDIPR
ncbi:MAG: NUDIX hydrolase [Phycisphaerales bacterium]